MYNFRADCNELLLVKIHWHNCSQARKVVEKGERYRKEGIDNREWLPTVWVINTRTILVGVGMSNFNLVGAMIPQERAKAVCGMVVMSCDWFTTKCLKYW